MESLNKNVVIIQPRNQVLNGQTQRRLVVQKELGIEALSPIEDNIKRIDKFDTLITFDTEDEELYLVLKQFPHKRLISHFQLNPSYLGLNSSNWKRSRELLSQSEFVIVPAVYLKEELHRYINTNIITVPNGVDKHLFAIKQNNSKNPLFGYVGKLTFCKGLQILQYLWENKVNNTTLQVDSADIVLPLTSETRILTNYSVNRQKHITPYMDCLISTSLSEVAPLVIIEALVSGVPVIATESSPYLREMQSYFGEKYIKLIPIPSRLLCIGATDLKLTMMETKLLGKQFLREMAEFKKIDYTDKIKIRNIALNIGYSSDRMCSSFRDIYYGL